MWPKQLRASPLTHTPERYVIYGPPRTINEVLTDGVGIGASGGRVGTLASLVSSGMLVGDTLSRIVTAAALVADSMVVGDSPSTVTTFNVSRADGLSVGEAIVGALSTETLTLTVSAGSDDGFEDGSNGNVLLTTTSLDADSTGDIIGFIVRGLNVANAANISNAYINVWTNNVDRDSASVTIAAEGNPANFTTTNSDFSNRTTTTTTVDWVEADLGIDAYKSSVDISSVIQEVVDDPGWTSGDDVAIFLTFKSGGGWLRISSYDENPSHAPQLVVTYTTGVQTVAATVADALVIGSLSAALLIGEVSLSDALLIADSISRSLSATRTASDGVVLSSLSSSTLATSTFLLDGLALADSPSAVSSLVVAALDAFVVSDTADWTSGIYGVVADSFVVGDALSPSLITFCSLDDAVVIADNGTVIASFFVDTTEGLSLSDALSVVTQFGAAVTDGFTLGDITFFPITGGLISVAITLKKPGITTTVNQAEFRFIIGAPGMGIELEQ